MPRKTLLMFILVCLALFAGLAANAADVKCLEFNGTDSVVNLPVSQGSPFTIEFWLKVNDATPQTFVLYTADDGASTWSNTFRINDDGNLELYLWDGSQQAVTGPAVKPGVWQHIAGTGQDDGPVYLYVDGVQYGPTEVGTIWVAGDKYLVGQKGEAFFTGQIDDLRIWDKARSQQDIKNDMNKELTGKEAGLVGNWQFNDGTGTTAADAAKLNPGTVEGAKWVTSTK